MICIPMLCDKQVLGVAYLIQFVLVYSLNNAVTEKEVLFGDFGSSQHFDKIGLDYEKASKSPVGKSQFFFLDSKIVCKGHMEREKGALYR